MGPLVPLTCCGYRAVKLSARHSLMTDLRISGSRLKPSGGTNEPDPVTAHCSVRSDTQRQALRKKYSKSDFHLAIGAAGTLVSEIPKCETKSVSTRTT